MTAPAWDLVVLDELDETYLQKTAEFLQGFTPSNVDPVWSVDYFKWKLGDQNPAGRGFLTCALSQGRVVGTVSIVRKRLRYNQRTIIGAEIGDTYTHPDFLKRPKHQEDARAALRQHNVFGRLAHETRARALDAGIRIIHGTPNALARPGWVKRMQFNVHPTHDNRTLVRPTITGLVSTRSHLRPLAPILSLGERAFERVTSLRWDLPRRWRGYTIDVMQQPTEELDALWERLKDQHRFSLVRDRVYFQHRFFEHPLATYAVYRISRRRQIQGLMVTRLLKTPWGKHYCALADWCIDERQPHLFAMLLAHVIHQHRHAPLDGFYLWCGPQRLFRNTLRWLGFLRADPSPIIFYEGEEGKQILEYCRDLDFTLASSDNI